MHRLIGIAAAAGLMAFTAGSASAQPSFDCSQATTLTEQTICADPGLGEADRHMDETYRAALANAADGTALRNSQREWLVGFQMCGDDTFCIYESYADRITLLQMFSGSSTDNSSPQAAQVEQPVEQVPPEETAESVQSEPPQEIASQEQPAPPTAQTVNDAQPGVSGNPAAALLGGGMIVGLILAVLIALGATKVLADHTSQRYGWPLIMNWWNILHFIGGAAFMFLAFVGLQPLMGAVVFAGCWLIVLIVNITKTNLVIGTLMTIIQPLVVAILWVLYGATRAKAEGRRI